MKFHNNWNDLSKFNSSFFYTKEETIASVKSNFDFRRKYSAEGKTIIVDDKYAEQVLMQIHTNPINGDRTDRKMHISIDSKIYRGSCISYENNIWLVVSRLKNVDNAFQSTQIQQCNYTLPFQIDSSTLYYAPCIVETQSSGIGEDENKVMTLPDTQRNIYIQYNDKTKYLIEGKRIFVDQFTKNPKVYHISKVDRICYMDGEHGLLKLTCDEDQKILDSDRPDLLIANYISDDLIPSPPSTVFGNCFITNTKNIVYNKPVELRIGGGKKPFIASFKDTGSNDVDSIPVWNLIDVPTILIDKIQVSYDSNYPLRCYIEVADENNLIGNSFKLQLKDDDDKLTLYEIICKVVSFI